MYKKKRKRNCRGSDFRRRRELFLAPVRRCMRVGGKSFSTRLFALVGHRATGWIISGTNSSFFSWRDGSTYGACASSTRVERWCLSFCDRRRGKEIFLFFDFFNIFLNYLKIYMCIYFCVYASSISGTLLLYFQDQNMKGIRVIRS